jgi:hypothetical protein
MNKEPLSPERNTGRGELKKASHEAFPLRTVEDKLRHLSAKGLAEMIRLDISSSHNLYFFAM